MGDVLEKDLLLLPGLPELRGHAVHGPAQLVQLQIPELQALGLQVAAADPGSEVGELLHRGGKGLGDVPTQQHRQQHRGGDHRQQQQIGLPGKGLDGGHVHVDQQDASLLQRILLHRHGKVSLLQGDGFVLRAVPGALGLIPFRQGLGHGVVPVEIGGDGALLIQHHGAAPGAHDLVRVLVEGGPGAGLLASDLRGAAGDHLQLIRHPGADIGLHREIEHQGHQQQGKTGQPREGRQQPGFDVPFPLHFVSSSRKP